AHSDHCPLLLRCAGLPKTKGPRPFRFLAAWAMHPKYAEIVQTSWNRGSPNVVNSLKLVQQESKSFNYNTFGNIFAQKRKLEETLN
ncbi:hypothetical protein PIB30_112079, partial [Stylosanthes scabra]|nr:hypothetical protein [Stylosanthes scabra]